MTSSETQQRNTGGGGGSWRHRKRKPYIGEFLYDRYQRYLKMNRCKMDIKYSTRYNSYFWNRIQVPDMLEMDIFVLPACKVNGVQMKRCHFAVDMMGSGNTAKFMVNVRELSSKLTQYSIFQDIKGLLAANLYNSTVDAGGNIAQVRQIVTGPVIGTLAYNCLAHYTKKNTLQDVLSEEQRKNMTIDNCLKLSG